MKFPTLFRSSAGASRQLTHTLFISSSSVALLNAGIAVMLKLALVDDGPVSTFVNDGGDGILKEPAVWSTFTFLLGIVVVFRTSQCYARWWEGSTAVFNMRAEWLDAVTTLNIFIAHCGADESKVKNFRHVLIRLMSLLHATSLAKLERGEIDGDGDCFEDLAYTYDVISPDAFDPESFETFHISECKPELVYGWILSLIMEHVDSGVLQTPPPLLTRALQELANGLVNFHSALRLVDVPFPIAYAHTCNGLLLIHWMIAPVVTSQWTTNPVWAGLFTFIQVFVLGLLNKVADGLANPFGTDPNDVDGAAMQIQMNKFLATTLVPGGDRAPVLIMECDDLDRLDAIESRRSLTQIYREASWTSGRSCSVDDEQGPPRRRGGSVAAAANVIGRARGRSGASDAVGDNHSLASDLRRSCDDSGHEECDGKDSRDVVRAQGAFPGVEAACVREAQGSARHGGLAHPDQPILAPAPSSPSQVPQPVAVDIIEAELKAGLLAGAPAEAIVPEQRSVDVQAVYAADAERIYSQASSRAINALQAKGKMPEKEHVGCAKCGVNL